MAGVSAESGKACASWGRWSAVRRACRRLLGQVDVAHVRPVPLLLDGGCLLAVLIVRGSGIHWAGRIGGEGGIEG